MFATRSHTLSSSVNTITYNPLIKIFIGNKHQNSFQLTDIFLY